MSEEKEEKEKRERWQGNIHTMLIEANAINVEKSHLG